jgi:hypothetical protein
MRSTLIGITLFAAVLTIAACEGMVPSTSTKPTTTQPVTTVGRVVYRESASANGAGASGGFFGILADDGRQYEPANLDVGYHVEGLKIAFSGQRDTTKLGEHAWGNPVEIAKVESSK